MVIISIGKLIRSTEFIINDKNDSRSFPLFDETPDLEKYPALIPRPRFNIEKHTKLCSLVQGRIEESGYKELLDLPAILNNYPASEEFSVLLERIRKNVVPTAAKAAPISADPNNVQIEAFKKSGIVEQIWKKPQFELTQNAEDNNPPAAPVPKKQKLPTKSKSTTPSTSAKKKTKESTILPKKITGKVSKSPQEEDRKRF
jgi:hypothetical protein